MANMVMKFLCACNLLYPVNTIRIPELLFSLFAFGVYCVFLRIGISRILFTYFLIIDYISAIRGISFMISRAIWSCQPQSWPDVLVCVTLYALTLPLLMVLFRKYGPTIYNPNTAPGLWRVIWLIPAANTLIILIFTNDFDPCPGQRPPLFNRPVPRPGQFLGDLFPATRLLEKLDSPIHFGRADPARAANSRPSAGTIRPSARIRPRNTPGPPRFTSTSAADSRLFSLRQPRSSGKLYPGIWHVPAC